MALRSPIDLLDLLIAARAAQSREDVDDGDVVRRGGSRSWHCGAGGEESAEDTEYHDEVHFFLGVGGSRSRMRRLLGSKMKMTECLSMDLF